MQQLNSTPWRWLLHLTSLTALAIFLYRTEWIHLDDFYSALCWKQPRIYDAEHPYFTKTILCICIVFLVEFSLIPRYILSSRLFQLLGKASFGLYCLHLCKLSFLLLSLVVFRSFGHRLVLPLSQLFPESHSALAFFTYVGLLLVMIPHCILFYHVADRLGVWLGNH